MGFKKIEAIIRTEKLDEVRMAVEGVGIVGMTVTEVKGRGSQKGILLEWRAGEYRVEFLPKLKLELVVHDVDLEKAVEALSAAARTGKVGDGKIFIYSMEDIVRVRTGERGRPAV
ncbi:P-II family nitrogen regulator [Candidatus Saganbacteria bacterium]|nr:P-II family nitrogen regulator [Candidatus Saganbacteria bacterium]